MHREFDEVDDADDIDEARTLRLGRTVPSREAASIRPSPPGRPGERGASESRFQARDFRGVHLREAEALLAEVLEGRAETGNPASRAAARRRRGPDWNGRHAGAPRPVTT